MLNDTELMTEVKIIRLFMTRKSNPDSVIPTKVSMLDFRAIFSIISLYDANFVICNVEVVFQFRNPSIIRFK